jgi:hypothetical protein
MQQEQENKCKWKRTIGIVRIKVIANFELFAGQPGHTFLFLSKTIDSSKLAM